MIQGTCLTMDPLSYCFLYLIHVSTDVDSQTRASQLPWPYKKKTCVRIIRNNALSLQIAEKIDRVTIMPDFLRTLKHGDPWFYFQEDDTRFAWIKTVIQ